ncbi:hypothetical protein V8F20_007649 [Naviculisporaceae sp. PSN 640]
MLSGVSGLFVLFGQDPYCRPPTFFYTLLPISGTGVEKNMHRSRRAAATTPSSLYTVSDVHSSPFPHNTRDLDPHLGLIRLWSTYIFSPVGFDRELFHMPWADLSLFTHLNPGMQPSQVTTPSLVSHLRLSRSDNPGEYFFLGLIYNPIQKERQRTKSQYNQQNFLTGHVSEVFKSTIDPLSVQNTWTGDLLPLFTISGHMYSSFASQDGGHSVYTAPAWHPLTSIHPTSGRVYFLIIYQPKEKLQFLVGRCQINKVTR